ncbi:MAG: phosphoribosyltransferase family protein [Candidatus Micrarchaeota archaeon]
MSEAAYWPDYYAGLVVKVFAPKLYYPYRVKKDEYSAKIVFSKKRDLSDYFLKEVETVFSKLPFKPGLIVVVPASKLNCFSPTVLALAGELSAKFGVANENILVRVKEERKLTNCKSFDERYASIKDSFKATRKLKGEKIVLLDDTRATGMTLLECAKTLKAAGASDVEAVCLGINSRE